MDTPVSPSDPPNPPSSQALAITSLVLAIVGVVLSFVLIGALFGALGILFGAVHLTNGRRPNTMAKWGVGLSIFAIAAGIGFACLYGYFYKQMRQAVQSASNGTDLTKWQGVIAPDFAFKTLDGQNLKLSDLKGKRVVLDFWATWCPPCRQELPHFQKHFGETSRSNLMIVGISDEEPATLASFVKKNGINYLIASATNLPAPYKQIESIPTTFYIDRNGVIQDIAVGYHDFSDIKANASNPDYAGKPLSAPAEPKPMASATNGLQAAVAWTKSIPGAQAICVGHWESPGALNVLVESGSSLHVLDLAGVEKANISLPNTYATIECGRGPGGKPRLLGYGNWGKSVQVVDDTGKQLWECSAFFGIDGAHWGDLDGDGVDEMVVGMNGNGGLKAFDPAGKQIWSVALGNVWNQAIISATPGSPARVLATEAAGSVHIYDSKGNSLADLRPNGGYYTRVSAQAIDAQTIQILAMNETSAVAFDEAGKVQWKSDAPPNHSNWQNSAFAAGDIMGDGAKEWALIDGNGSLVVATTNGTALASIPEMKDVADFAIASSGSHGVAGLLLTLRFGQVTAYDFAPGAGTNAVSAQADRGPLPTRP